MKTIITIIGAVCAMTAQAKLIDFGVVDNAQDYIRENTGGRTHLLGQFYFDPTVSDQWIVMFGPDGDPYLPPASDFGVPPETPPPTMATLNWNLTGEYYNVRWILVSSTSPSGEVILHLYHPRLDSQTIGEGLVATLNQPIFDIGFYGKQQSDLPDSGSTIVLFALAAGLLLTAYRNQYN